ncbi:MAG: RluA family pseudouridine synthase [Bacilli bacterium]|jgi:23S rRNA pseudouridine1911/1915/1917 synthase|nr:RluA family pseudouridine synthase [Bacilli bacterium]
MNKNDAKAHRGRKGLVNLRRIKTFLVYHETTLLPFVREKAGLSNTIARHVISASQVSVGGAPVTLFDFKLYPEDEVVVSYDRIAHHLRHDLPIIFEDEDIVALNKPSGLLSVATEREKGRTAYRLVSDYVTAKNPRDRIFVVHRLDEDTSGVLVFAKKWEVREALQNNWQKCVKKRGYYAVVEGNDIPDSGILKDYLAQDNFQLVYVTKNRAKGKLAITEYKKMASSKEYALLDVRLRSGRKNQIRVQLGNIGHYVIGDDKYGEPSNPLKRLGLHAYELWFTNPLNGKEYDLQAPLPESFKRLFWKSDKFKKEEIGERKERREPHGRKGERGSRAKEERFGH